MTGDELAAVCPTTGQPDLYVATIDYAPDALCLALRQKSRGGITITATA